MEQNKLIVNTYRVLEDCVQCGIDAGWNKAHKHTDTPSEQEIKEQIEHYIMLNVDEYFKFPELE